MKQPITLRPGNSLFRLCDGNGQDLRGRDFCNDSGERKCKNCASSNHYAQPACSPVTLGLCGGRTLANQRAGASGCFAHQLPGGSKEGNNVYGRLAQYHKPRQPRNALLEVARKTSGRSRTARNGAMLWLAVANAAELTISPLFQAPGVSPASGLLRIGDRAGPG